ncbi:immunoglobulin domain-containing protein [Psychrosphaera sp. B3R10]|uniref:immunoglobulin domain-containing protein n=1 Tax=unclassified Psychrosphaera TaxID=2641570 RepID=UPI001C08FD63|nr:MULTISPECIES: immunoglobulin domain-containing protein [unclassified Psychrosphaera]MBU2882063.1 immunoglobulin domain-containing protein [Psychrosphaera sp. I2R16]MBU2990437.1 immunoglobulin domain-containing protein [Psychrosphaera sp. B3R10]
MNLLQKLTGMLLILFLISCGGEDSSTKQNEQNNTETGGSNTGGGSENGGTSETKRILVDVTNINQTISMMGGDMERSHRNFGQVDNQQEVIRWVAKDIKFDTWRVAYDKHQEMTEGVKDFSIYDNAVKAMQLIKLENPNIKFFATLESDYHGYSQGNRNNLPTWIYDYAYLDSENTGSRSFDAVKYGLFLADYVEYMSQSGVPVSYIATSKEYVGVITVDRAKVAIETLQDALTARNIAMPLIIDAGTWSLSNGIKLIGNYQAKGINQYVAGYSSHNYWSGETKSWGDFIQAANDAGKFAYNEESGHGGGGQTIYESDFNYALGTYAAKTEMYSAGLQGEAIFELWPRGYNEIQTNKYFAKPIFFNKGTDGRRMRSYYLMKHFANNAVDSKYVSTLTTNLDSLSTMAFIKGDSLALWVINNQNDAQDEVEFVIDQLNLKTGMTVQHRVWQESTAIEGLASTIELQQDGKFTADIDLNSLNLFIIKPQYPLTQFVKTDDSEFTEMNNQAVAVIEAGDSVEFEPKSTATGTWHWNGPNIFSADQAHIQLSNITPEMAGYYQATFSDSDGNTSAITTELAVDCKVDPELSFEYQINQESRVDSQTSIYLNTGDKLNITPLSQTSGDWHWTGPGYIDATQDYLAIATAKLKHAGQYTAHFTSDAGCRAKLEFDVNIACSDTPTIEPKMFIAGKWQSTYELEYRNGDTFQIGPTSPDVGRWQWTGPNDFKAIEVRQLSFADASEAQQGQYTATLTTPLGCSSSAVFETKLVEGECTPSTVTPYIRVNEGTWQKVTSVTVKVGDTIDLGPQPHSGTWSWSGPKGFSSSERQIQISNLQLDQAGTYTATYTPANGCPGTAEFVIEISQ